MLMKTGLEIIKEAAKSEGFEITSLENTELKSQYSDCINDIPVIQKRLVGYRAEMVPVFKNESSYFVEMDNVLKYMNTWEISDVKEAVENIADVNDIPSSQISLVIETKEYMDSVIESAITMSKNGDKSLLEDCELSIKLINLLKQEGINVVLSR